MYPLGAGCRSGHENNWVAALIRWLLPLIPAPPVELETVLAMDHETTGKGNFGLPFVMGDEPVRRHETGTVVLICRDSQGKYTRFWQGEAKERRNLASLAPDM
jgi:hypothetical protein